MRTEDTKTFSHVLPYLYAMIKHVGPEFGKKVMSLALIVYTDIQDPSPILAALKVSPAANSLRRLVTQLEADAHVTSDYINTEITKIVSEFDKIKTTYTSSESLDAFIEDGERFYDLPDKLNSSHSTLRKGDISVAGDITGGIVNLGDLRVGRDLNLSTGLPDNITQLIEALGPRVNQLSSEIKDATRRARLQGCRDRVVVFLAQTILVLSVTAAVGAAIIWVIYTNPQIGICLPFLPPHKMASDGLDVLLAGFSSVDKEGKPTDAEDADRKNAIIAAELQQIDSFHVRAFKKDCTVGRIEAYGLEPAEAVTARRAQAQAFAISHGADIVIYGVVTNYQTSINLKPEIYIAPSFAATQPELLESETFAQPITVPRGPTDTVGFTNYARLLRGFIDGIDQFLRGQYQAAENSFITTRDTFLNTVKGDETLDVGIRSGKGLEIFLIMAGNAASRQNNCEAALIHYTKSLENRPNYARGLLGRGQAFFGCAGELYREYEQRHQQPPTFDTGYTLPGNSQCRDAPPTYEQIEALIAMAQLCIKEAKQSSDFVLVADLDVKIPYLEGQMQSWLADRNYGASWPTVITLTKSVIVSYQESDKERQDRLLVIAVRAYATLGKAYARMACLEPASKDQHIQKAIDHYRESNNLFEGYSETKLAQDHQNLIDEQLQKLTEIQQSGSDTCSLNFLSIVDE